MITIINIDGPSDLGIGAINTAMHTKRKRQERRKSAFCENPKISGDTYYFFLRIRCCHILVDKKIRRQNLIPRLQEAA